MERDVRSTVATFFTEGAIDAGASVALNESAAHHARVKRLTVDDAVLLTNGKGTIARGAIDVLERGKVSVRVNETSAVPSPPEIHLRVPIGDRDRMLLLAEKATELGITTWQAVRFRRSASVNPRGEGPAFAEKARARMVSALEQSSGAWLPSILPDASPSNIDLPLNATRILLDVAGGPLLRISDSPSAVVLFGPEGGLERDERDALIGAGWQPAMLAGTTLRFETAGIAAIAVLRAAHHMHSLTES